MQSYGLRRGKLLLEVAGALFVASASAAVGIDRGRTLPVILAVVLVVGALGLATRLAKRGPVLAYDRSGIRLAAFGRPLEIGWNRIRRIYVQRLEAEGRRGYGFSVDERWERFSNVDIERRKVSFGQGFLAFAMGSSRDRLMVEYANAGGVARTARIDSHTMTLPEGGVVELAAELMRTQESTLGRQNLAYARLGVQPAEVPKATVTGVQADRFRRLGLATGEVVDDPQPQLTAPAPGLTRPAFGRRGVQ